MSLKSVVWALEQDTQAGPKLTLIALANFADDGHHAWPSQDTMAKLTCQCVRTVRRSLVTLEQKGLIARAAEQRRKAAGRFGQDLYHLAIKGDAQAPDVAVVEGKIADRLEASRADKMAARRADKMAARRADKMAATGGQNGRPSNKDDPVSGTTSDKDRRAPARALKSAPPPAAGPRVGGPGTGPHVEAWAVFLAAEGIDEPARCVSWFRPMTVEGHAIIAPTRFHADWIRSHYTHLLADAGLGDLDIRVADSPRSAGMADQGTVTET